MIDIIKELRETGMSMEEAKRLAPIILKRDNRIAELKRVIYELEADVSEYERGAE